MEAVVGVDKRSRWLTIFFLVLFFFSVIHDDSAEAKKRRRGKRRGAAAKIQQRRKRRRKRRFVRRLRRNEFFAAVNVGNGNNFVPIFNDFNGGIGAFNPFFNQALAGGFNNFGNVPVITNGGGFGGGFNADVGVGFGGGFGRGLFNRFGGFVPIPSTTAGVFNAACNFQLGQCVQLNQNDVLDGQIVNPNLAQTNTQLAVVRQDGQLKMLGAQDVKQGQPLRTNTLQDMRRFNDGEIDFNAVPGQGSGAGSESNVVSLRPVE